jgi:hypothetical protein
MRSWRSLGDSVANEADRTMPPTLLGGTISRRMSAFLPTAFFRAFSTLCFKDFANGHHLQGSVDELDAGHLQRIRPLLDPLVELDVLQVLSQAVLGLVAEVVEPEQVDRLHWVSELGPRVLAELGSVAHAKMGHDVMMRRVLAVLVPKRTEHAFSGHAGRVHRERVPAEPPQLLCVAHALESDGVVLGKGRRHAPNLPRDCMPPG